MKDKSIKDLVDRINQIMVEMNNLEMEYNQIVYELWDRIPSLKDDVNIQPKENERPRKRDKVFTVSQEPINKRN
ncbi:hypothetical protein IJE86_01395 [bacterium]|nr:hypothetical protein [bacterium]